MAKNRSRGWCQYCGRKSGKAGGHAKSIFGPICNMAEVKDGDKIRIVHVDRIEAGGDLHDRIGKGKGDIKVIDRHIKKAQAA